jgi:UMF1 family MFS transporter
VLYDLANTIFSMGVLSAFFALWARDQVGKERADSVVGWATAVSMATIFVVSPLLGAMTDRARKRMPFLVASTLVCVAFTALLARVGYVGTLIAFGIANIAYQAGLQFYDALLVEVTTEENRGRIGGIGIGLGYVGSYIAIGFGVIFGTGDKSLLFTLIAIGFLAFAIPCFFFVHERGNANPGNVFDFDAVVHSMRNTVRTLREGERYPGLVRFLIGRMFYTDAINTVIAMMTLYATNIVTSHGQTQAQAEKVAQFVLLGAITFAIPGGLVWGRIVDRIGPRRTLDRVLWLWFATFGLAAVSGLFGLPIYSLWLVSAMAGIAIGGTWSADRPLMLRLTPPDRVGEFYGLYGMVGRFSAVTGPAMWALIVPLMIHQFGFAEQRAEGVGILALLAMIIVSWFILRGVDDAPRNWQALRTAPVTNSGQH